MSSLASVIASPVTALLTTVIDRVFPDKVAQAQERAQLMIQAQQLDTQLAQAQMAVNQAEASNGNIFVSGWRPFIGWVCGSAFAYHLIVQPLLAFCFAAVGHTVDLPDFDSATLNTTLMGMLGLGAMRTVEKVQGVANEKG